MSERPHNVEAEGQEVTVKAHLTRYWFRGKRWPIIYLLDVNGEPNYKAGFPVVTGVDQHAEDPRLVG